MVNCILYRSVNIPEEIKSIHVRTYVQITYNDIHVFDWNGEKISIEIENIPLAFDSQMAANPMEMNIELEVSSNFKYNTNSCNIINKFNFNQRSQQVLA